MGETYKLDAASAKPRCRHCGGVITKNAVLCIHCGTDQSTGQKHTQTIEERPRTDRSGTKVKPKKRVAEPFGEVCANCGYDVTTLPGRPCPECGHERRANAARHAKRKLQMRTYWRNTALIASIAGVLGAAATAFLFEALVATGAWLDGILFAAISVAVIEASYFACCLTFLGFEGPKLGTAVRLIGVGAAWSALFLLVSQIPFILVSLVAGAFLLGGTAAIPIKMLTGREEWSDCFIIGIAATMIRFGVFFACGF